MAYTTIKKPSDYFNTVLYTGTEPSNKAVTGVNFRPDLVWIKQRSGTEGHYLADVLRGSTKVLRSNENSVENDRGSNGIQSFDSDGFTAGGGDDINSNGGTFVSWNWKANGSGSANTDGTINSTVSVNTTAGFSIVSYTGTGSNGTVGHGLGVVPKVIITKARTNSGRFWGVYHASKGNTGSQPLNDTQAFDVSSTYWQDTNPTSSVFSVGSNGDSNSSSGMIAYCFADVVGYSKFGSYIGNGNSNGTFVYTGFKPAWVVIKRTNSTGNWIMFDSKRDGFNTQNDNLYPNSTSSEQPDGALDIFSNGFKCTVTGTDTNGSGSTYIYMAFAEEPLIGDNPATAR